MVVPHRGGHRWHEAVGRRSLGVVVEVDTGLTAFIPLVHSTLRVALEHAVREELVTRNVARSVRVERPEAGTTASPVTPDEARRFLVAVKDHRLYAPRA